MRAQGAPQSAPTDRREAGRGNLYESGKEQRGERMQAASVNTAIQPAPFAERHYSVAEVASLWGLSDDTVRRIFTDEPGVLSISNPRGRHRRRYAVLRIPESVLARVHRGMTKS